MSNARNLANLLNSSGDVKTSALDNAPAPTKSSIDALGVASTSVTGSQASAITANTAKVTNYNQTKSDIVSLGIADDTLSNVSSLPSGVVSQLTGATGATGATGPGSFSFSSGVLTITS